MKRRYLLKYEIPTFFALKDWIDYTLYLEVVWFWGLFKTNEKIEYRIYNSENLKSYFDHWDKLIKDKLIITKYQSIN